MYKKTLVANRGEIAVRIIKALKELGIQTVAIYSWADRNALHVKLADESVCIGEGSSLDSYLNMYKVLAVASMKGVDSIHPGIGFFAEDSGMAKLCKECSIDFIGPDDYVIDSMGNKAFAKKIAEECGVPVIKGSKEPIVSLDDCRNRIQEIGLPVMIKATNGGGGKGIRVIHEEKDIEKNYFLCQKEAEASFESTELIVEQFLQNTRHVEVQILGDKYGNIIHLGDRECTIQRSNQKLIEEARCANISEEIRGKLYKDAIALSRHIGYVGPGTVEFLVDINENYYFLEMNTRLQVEHTVTELISGIDIVKEQMKIFSGETLKIRQEDISFDQYALQCRIIAEDVNKNFIPSFGEITKWDMPGGYGTRVDGGYTCHDVVSPYYDSLLTKICCVAGNKNEAVRKMQVCLSETRIEGIQNNIGFLRYILDDEQFLLGNYQEGFVERALEAFQESR